MTFPGKIVIKISSYNSINMLFLDSIAKKLWGKSLNARLQFILAVMEYHCFEDHSKLRPFLY